MPPKERESTGYEIPDDGEDDEEEDDYTEEESSDNIVREKASYSTSAVQQPVTGSTMPKDLKTTKLNYESGKTLMNEQKQDLSSATGQDAAEDDDEDEDYEDDDYEDDNDAYEDDDGFEDEGSDDKVEETATVVNPKGGKSTSLIKESSPLSMGDLMKDGTSSSKQTLQGVKYGVQKLNLEGKSMGPNPSTSSTIVGEAV